MCARLYRVMIDHIVKDDDIGRRDDGAGVIAKSRLEQIVLEDDGEDDVSCAMHQSEQIMQSY